MLWIQAETVFMQMLTWHSHSLGAARVGWGEPRVWCHRMVSRRDLVSSRLYLHLFKCSSLMVIISDHFYWPSGTLTIIQWLFHLIFQVHSQGWSWIEIAACWCRSTAMIIQILLLLITPMPSPLYFCTQCQHGSLTYIHPAHCVIASSIEVHSSRIHIQPHTYKSPKISRKKQLSLKKKV